MRTTIDMPPALLRAAKVRAAEQGESLTDLINRAIAREIGMAAAPEGRSGRVAMPLIARDASPAVHLTSDDMTDAFESEDIERHAAQ